jgi:hypothetical protein
LTASAAELDRASPDAAKLAAPVLEEIVVEQDGAPVPADRGLCIKDVA